MIKNHIEGPTPHSPIIQKELLLHRLELTLVLTMSLFSNMAEIQLEKYFEWSQN